MFAGSNKVVYRKLEITYRLFFDKDVNRLFLKKAGLDFQTINYINLINFKRKRNS
jgi:hypothetical protein